MSVIHPSINARRSHVYFLIAAVLCGALSGCGAEQQSGPAQASTTSVKLKITMPQKVASVSNNSTGFLAKVSQWLFPTEAWAANPSDIAALIVQVTGPGIPDSITKREPVGDLIGGEVVPIVLDVPIGEGRVFTVSAVNAANTTIFHGQSSAMTLTLGQVATADIQLADIAITITTTSSIPITTTSLPVGAVGTDYLATLQVERAIGTPIWELIQGALPVGLTLSETTGVISGRSSTGGIFTFRVRATDSVAWDDQELSITIVDKLEIITTQLHEGTAGAPYRETLQTAGGFAPVTWAVQGNLPLGLTLDTSTGEIIGTPSISCSECSNETTSFTIVATDSLKQIATQGLEIVIAASLVVETSFLPDAVVGFDYLDFSSEISLPVQLSVFGGVGPYTWSQVDPLLSPLPNGLTLDGLKGIISGVPADGTGSCQGIPYNTVFEVRDSNGAVARSGNLGIIVYDDPDTCLFTTF